VLKLVRRLQKCLKFWSILLPYRKIRRARRGGKESLEYRVGIICHRIQITAKIRILSMEEHVLDTNAGKQLSSAATDV
jgi:hypothetical protein